MPRPLALALMLTAAQLAAAPRARADAPRTPSRGGAGRPTPWRDPHAPPRPLAAPTGAHLDYLGGQVVGHMQVIQVLWGAGSYEPGVAGAGTPSMASFFQQLLARSTLPGWLDREYNTVAPPGPGTGQRFGPGVFLAQVTITPYTTAAVLDDGAVRAELEAQIAAGHLPLPALDDAGHPATYYAVFFPQGTTITLGGSSSCVAGGFCGYHGTVPAGEAPEFYYGVHPDMQAGSGCDVGCGAPGTTPFQTTCAVASHELMETLTDPEVGLAAGDGPPLAWYDPRHGEIGDLCNGQVTTLLACDGQRYVYQQGFSNARGDCIGVEPSCGPSTAPAVALRFASAAAASPAAVPVPAAAPADTGVKPVLAAAPMAAQAVALPAAPAPADPAPAPAPAEDKPVIIDESALGTVKGR